MPSEEPEIARTRHHWIVLFAPLPRWLAIMLGILLLWGWLDHGMLIALIVVLAVIGGLRWQTWQAEVIVLTKLRILRLQGVVETTTSEAWLRVDRISGARLIQTVPGKLLHYVTIELEAPGNHPDVRRLVKIEEGDGGFYETLMQTIFTGRSRPDPDDAPPPPHVTEKLPRYPS